jgi:hypothetical protein
MSTHGKKNALVLAGKIWASIGIAVQFLKGYKECSGEPVRNAIGDRLQRPCYLNKVDHGWKIRNRRQRMDIGIYSFVYRIIQLWNKLPMNALRNFPAEISTFRQRVRKVISEVK